MVAREGSSGSVRLVYRKRLVTTEYACMCAVFSLAYARNTMPAVPVGCCRLHARHRGDTAFGFPFHATLRSPDRPSCEVTPSSLACASSKSWLPALPLSPLLVIASLHSVFCCFDHSLGTPWLYSRECPSTCPPARPPVSEDGPKALNMSRAVAAVPDLGRLHPRGYERLAHVLPILQ